MRLASLNLILTFIFLAFLALSIIYAEERVIILDNALHLFLCINNEELNVMAGRWPIAIVRLGLLLGIKVKLDLSTLITVYSISHFLLKWALIVLAYRMGGLKYLTLCLILLLLPLCHSYFWCVSELIPALLMIVPLPLLLEQTKYSPPHYLILLLIPIAFFSHPQSMLAIVFVILFHLGKNNIKISTLAFGILGITMMIKSYFLPNWYDTMKMDGLKSNLISYNFNPFGTTSFQLLSSWMLDSLFWIPIIYILCNFLLLSAKKWFKLILYNGSILLSIYLFILSNPESVNKFYAESSTYLISFFSAFIIIDTFKNHRVLTNICIALAFFSIVRILLVSPHYKERLQYIERLAKNQEYPKRVTNQKNIDLGIMGLDWGLPYETLIASELSSNRTVTTVTEDYRRNYNSFKDQKGVIYNGFGDVFQIQKARSYFNINFDGNYKWDHEKKGDHESDKEINH